ncbi:MAG: DUF2282 domain-containing protein [Gammaproteobacteria bacterium]|nr:DUF2282 domain-containing protein [Gammaproteobacteria bacterium]
MPQVNHWMKKVTAVAALGGVAMGMADTAHAAPSKTWHAGWVRCWGVNAAYKNDCLTATGACAGTDPRAHDPSAYVWMPVGTCTEIGGSAIPSAKAAAHIHKFLSLPPPERARIHAVPSLRERQLYHASAAQYLAEAAQWAKTHRP